MIDYQQWEMWSRQYNCLPYVVQHELQSGKVHNWSGCFEDMREAGFLLESGKSGRYSYVGIEPVEFFQAQAVGKPFEKLRQWMKRFTSPQIDAVPCFVGGIVGYLSYDVARTIERMPEVAAADSLIPDIWFMRVEKLWVIDHTEHKLYCVVHKLRVARTAWSPDQLRQDFETACAEADAMKIRWDLWMQRQSVQPDQQSTGTFDVHIEQIPGIELSLPKDHYMRAVHEIQHFIRQGDVFQVNLSVRQSKNCVASPEEIYESLRSINPSPYMAYLKLPGGASIVSGSPELLVRLQRGVLSTRPIAGTRPRGTNDIENNQNETDLLLNEKERAEHIMLVDLQRNDLGKIANYGSVRVEELMAVEHYSHVMHIVSEVTGVLSAGKDAFDTIAAVFPGGTITGAPKIRTMEIIEALEPVRRGIYTGSIGWIDYNGNMELNIVIRTLLHANGRVYVQSGAGIVIDSLPEKEFYESLNKAKALWKAVEISEQRLRIQQS
jgi:para-aminobenzoate synthetase component 1